MKKVRQYSVEIGFISKLVETKDMKTIKELDVKPYFLTGENRRIYKYICDSYRNTGEVPTPRVLNQKFPSYELETHFVEDREVVGTDETLLYWSNELRTKTKHNRMADIVEEVAEYLDNGKTEDAYALLKKGVLKIEEEVVERSTVDITKDTSDRKQAYLNKKKNKGIQGIPTGLEHLDFLTKGLVDETLTTIVASSGVGKTWLEVLFASYMMLNNYKVSFFVTEMSAELMRDRFEAMLFGMMYGGFNYSKFKSGSLPKDVEDTYFQFLDEDLPKLEPLILETATGVSSVVSVIERDRPDIVFIDGAYLMEDEQGAKDDWLRVTHITRDLKKTAKSKHIPIVINSQTDLRASKKSGARLEDVKYTQSIVMDSDNVFSLFRDEVMINDKEMCIKILKQREGILGKLLINWDFDNMDFKSIYSETNSSDDKDSEEEEETSDKVIGMD